jgi:hypothetical protein
MLLNVLFFGCYSGDLFSMLYSAGLRIFLVARLRSQSRILLIAPVMSPSFLAHGKYK